MRINQLLGKDMSPASGFQGVIHEKQCAFIMAVMSHGEKDVIFSADGVPLDIEKDIVAPFDGANCAALIDKPKIFFIQACRGKGMYSILCILCILMHEVCRFTDKYIIFYFYF